MGLKQIFASNPAKLRKERSEKYLNKMNIKINPQLPDIQNEATIKLKSTEETLKRAITALFASQIALDCTGKPEDIKESASFFTEMLQRFSFTDEPTPEEKIFFALTDRNNPIPPAKMAGKLAWRVEMAMPLLWALGFIKDLGYPDSISGFIEVARKIVSCKNYDELYQLCNMRSPTKILDKADLLFRMNWACTDARQNGEGPTGNLNPEVVAEQHKGLSWLIGAENAEDWDNVNPY